MLRITTGPTPPTPPVGEDGTTGLGRLPVSGGGAPVGAITNSLGVAGEHRIGEFELIICALGLMLTMGDCGVVGPVCICGDFIWLDIEFPSFCRRFTNSGDDIAILLLPVDVAVGAGDADADDGGM